MDTQERSLLRLGDSFFANGHHALTAEELPDTFPQLDIDDSVIAMYAGHLVDVAGRYVRKSIQYRTKPQEDWLVLTIFRDLDEFGLALPHFCTYVLEVMRLPDPPELIATPSGYESGARILIASFEAIRPRLSLYEPACTPETKEVTWLTYRL